MSSSEDSWDAPPQNKRKTRETKKPPVRSKESEPKGNPFEEQEQENVLEEDQLEIPSRPAAQRWKFPEPSDKFEEPPDKFPEPSSAARSTRSLPKYQETAPPEPRPYYQSPMAATATNSLGVDLERRLVIGIDFGTTFTGSQALTKFLKYI
jgi:hypothetical protein